MRKTAKPKIAKDTKQTKPAWLSVEAMALSRRNEQMGMDAARKMFMPAEPAPGVLPKGTKLAMDDNSAFFNNSQIGWAANQIYNTAFSQGYTFLGYAYLSELAQIPEYRLISEVISTEATRRWIKIQSVSEDEEQEEQIKELEDEFKRLRVRDLFQTISEQDGWFGRSHLYIDTGDTDNPDELKKPIGNGDEFSEKKIKQGSLRAFKPVEPVWCYPSNYNANDPMKDTWYNPTSWFVMSREVHQSRFLTFVSMPVPDLLKPAFSFGGLSRTQMAKPYVDNWLQTRQSVNDLIQAFSQMVLSTDMNTTLAPGQSTGLMDRIDMFNNLRNNRGTMVLNKGTEELTNVSVPLGTLDKLQAQAQEHMASISRIPLVKLLGISPAGLNASSDGEIRAFYDTIHAYQERFFTPHLMTVFKMAQINLWGKVDPDLTFIYEPLWEMDEVEQAGMRKTEAETDAIYIDKGILDPAESRQRIADDPDAPYGPIDPDDVPEPMEMEPGNIKESIKPDAGGKAGGGASSAKKPGTGKTEAKKPAKDKKPKSKK